MRDAKRLTFTFSRSLTHSLLLNAFISFFAHFLTCLCVLPFRFVPSIVLTRLLRARLVPPLHQLHYTSVLFLDSVPDMRRRPSPVIEHSYWSGSCRQKRRSALLKWPTGASSMKKCLRFPLFASHNSPAKSIYFAERRLLFLWQPRSFVVLVCTGRISFRRAKSKVKRCAPLLGDEK